MKNMVWLLALLAGGAMLPSIIAQEEGPPSPPPGEERMNMGIKEKRYQAALADLRARIEALERRMENQNRNRPDLPSNQPLPPPQFNRLPPGPGPEAERGRLPEAERGRLNPPPTPGPGPREFANPPRNLGLPPEQMEMLRKRVAETRERQMILQEKLMAARQELQEAACEQRINEEAIKDQAMRVGKIVAEMALTQGKLIRELREKLPPEKFEQLEPYLKRGLRDTPDWRPRVRPDDLRRPQARPNRRPPGPPRGDMGGRNRNNPDWF
jgi:hypothetical protein